MYSPETLDVMNEILNTIRGGICFTIAMGLAILWRMK